MSDLSQSAGKDTKPVVLVLDDDQAICRAATRILELYSYTVLTAGSAHEALGILDATDDPIDLLLCDLLLPGLGGRDAANVLLAHRPGMKVLYTSGYSTHDSHRASIEQSGEAFLSKPFDVPELVNAVAEALKSKRR
ncbi:MAG: response regulator [Gemmatimonadetes bacterium]|jgi:two-component system, cell cycle sensor histidine kinase and response regulator CckA|nr:response regulator [Gemmatimonadota bacterium]